MTFLYDEALKTHPYTHTHAHPNTFKTVSIKNFTTDFPEHCCAHCTHCTHCTATHYHYIWYIVCAICVEHCDLNPTFVSVDGKVQFQFSRQVNKIKTACTNDTHLRQNFTNVF